MKRMPQLSSASGSSPAVGFTVRSVTSLGSGTPFADSVVIVARRWVFTSANWGSTSAGPLRCRRATSSCTAAAFTGAACPSKQWALQ